MTDAPCFTPGQNLTYHAVSEVLNVCVIRAHHGTRSPMASNTYEVIVLGEDGSLPDPAKVIRGIDELDLYPDFAVAARSVISDLSSNLEYSETELAAAKAEITRLKVEIASLKETARLMDTDFQEMHEALKDAGACECDACQMEEDDEEDSEGNPADSPYLLSARLIPSV